MDLEALETTEDSIPSIISIVEMTPEEASASLKVSPHHNAKPLKTIRTKHHHVAKLLAARFKDADIARKTGYAVGTINTLKSNPAIKELVEHYSGEYQESMDELHERMEALTIDLMDELQDRLDSTERKEISVSELKDLLKDLLDRTGRGPIKRIERHSTSENLHGGIIRHVREVAAEKRFDSGGADHRIQVSAPEQALPEGRRLGVGEIPVQEPLGQRAAREWVGREGSGI